MGPGQGKLRRAGDDLRHADDVDHRAADRGAGELRHRAVPDRALTPVAQAAAGHRDRTAGRGAVDRLRHVGPAGVRPHPGHLRPGAAAAPVQGRALSRRAGLRTAGGHRHPVGRHHPGDHGHSVHRLGDARRVRRHAADAQGVGLRAGLDDLGGRLQGRAAVHQDRSHRRHHARPGPGTRRDDGGDLRDRQLEPAQFAVAVRGGQQHHFGAGQRIRRGRRRACTRPR